MRLAALTATLAATVATVAAAGPLAEVWPYQSKRVDAATLEYAYDLTALKQSGGNPDARAENGDEAVAAFLKALPRDVRLKVKSGPLLYISAARGIEATSLAVSFASVAEGPLASDDPLQRKPKARVRPALDPDEPKLLPAAEMVLWRARRLEDGALAAAALDTDRLLKGFLQQLQQQALARAKNGEGDLRDGALMLAARLAVALACLEPNRLSAPPSISGEAKGQLEDLLHDEGLPAPRGFWEWSDELKCAWRRWGALGASFAPSRGGYAAGLVTLSLLKDPKLKVQWLKLRGRRDALFGGPQVEPLSEYLAKAGGDADVALDDMMPVIDRQGSTPPPVLAAPRAPFAEFLQSLSGPERAQPVDELSTAVADGRVRLPTETTAGVEALRQAALAAFSVAEQPKGLQFDAGWRDRLVSAFCALQGAWHEPRESNFEPSQPEVVRSELKVVLEAPPSLEVEPLPDAYRRASDAAARLASVLSVEGLASVSPIDPEGLPSAPAVPELKRWQSVLAGLAVISARETFETPDVANARRFLAGWRADPLLQRDVRFASAHPVAFDGERLHAVIAGVARRELSVQFAEVPQAEIVGGPSGVVADLKAEQRYLVPVLYALGYRQKASEPSLRFAPLRKAIDQANRQPLQIPAALPR
jgi:hypothetical protein